MPRYPYDDMLERQREALEDAPEIKVLKDKLVKARKKYQCADCGGDIEIGLQHRYMAALVDGQFYTERRHGGDCYYGPDIEGE